jgi:DNA-binding transcriptional ArsR family regulator
MSNTKLARRENESRSRVSGASQQAQARYIVLAAEPYGALSSADRRGPCPGRSLRLFDAEKLRVSHPTASEHLKILSQAGLIRGKRIKQWTFYKRDESTIRRIKKTVFPNV